MSAMTGEMRKEAFKRAYSALITSDGFRTLLKIRAGGGLTRFSLNNLMLIMYQCECVQRPLPTILKTYNQWQKVGRQVQKDEQGLVVFGPNLHKETDEDGYEREVLTGYHTIHEFDVSQTEGDPLPEPTPPLQSEDHVEEFTRLVEWSVFKHAVPVHWGGKEEMHGAKGFYDTKANHIYLREGMAVDEAVGVLVHELIHSLGVDYESHSRKDAEMITETAAAIVCLGMGLDQVAQSVEYVAYWAGAEPEKAITMLEKAEQLARELERALGKRVKYVREKVAA